jgi:hypothetical protein
VKYKIVAIPVLAAFAIFIISYTTMQNSSDEKPVVAENVKKAPKTTKAKVKKKTKIKSSSTGKRDNGKPSPAEDEEEVEDEKPTTTVAGNTTIMNVLTNKVNNYALENNMSTDYCFLVDMSLPSGRNRFFIYDLNRNSIVSQGLVSHGSCNETFIARPRFSNDSKSGCSSLGKYKVGEFYKGKYGKSFRLYGLDNCNSNAYNRAVVIHGYDCVPDQEIYPRVLCNSLGCVMVSYKFFNKISQIISKTDKPIVLWVYQ